MQSIPGKGTHYTDLPERDIRKAKAGGTIVKGDVVQWDTSDDDGVAVVAGAANCIPAGIALESASDGGYLYVQVSGYGLVPITTISSGVAAGEALIAGANADVDGIAIGSTLANYNMNVVGLALADDSSNVLAAGQYIVMCSGHGW